MTRSNWLLLAFVATAVALVAGCGGGGFTSSRPAPVVLSVEPATGGVGGGTALMIKGTGFLNDAPGLSEVLVGDVPAVKVIFESDTTVTCETPPHASGPVTVSVVKTHGTGSLADAFTFYPPPTLTSVDPMEGSRDGALPITVTGTGFQAGEPGTPVLQLGGIVCDQVVVVSDTTLTAETPTAYFEKAVDVVLTNRNGSATLMNGFVYKGPLPVVYAVTPPSGSTDGGEAVVVTGDFFTIVGGELEVAFAGQKASDVFRVDDQTLTCVTPPSNVYGLVDVTVKNVNGTGTLPNGFDFIPAPLAVSGIEPNHGPEGVVTNVTISGSGFQKFGAGTPTVTFDGTSATNIVVVSDSQITCRTPGLPSGPADVTVTNTRGSATLTDGYLYEWIPKWQSSFGNSLGNLGDEGIVTGTIGFSFPFANTTYTTCRIKSNGFCTFGGDNTLYYSGSFQTYPQINVAGADLGNNGTIYNYYSSNLCVVTFSGCCWYYNSGTITAQIQLHSSGAFAIMWNSISWIGNLMIGFFPGSGSSQQSVDFSTQPAIPQGTAPYQNVGSGLVGTGYVFRPNGTGGYTTTLLTSIY